MAGDKLSRRDFLKLGISSLGGLAFNQLPNTLKPLNNHTSESASTTEVISVGNLQITPIITEHDQKTWDTHGKTILEKLEDHQLIIPEYFPPDYEPHLKENPAFDFAVNKLTDYPSLNVVFNKVAEYCYQSPKLVTVVDPAYSEAFIKLRASRNWWMPVWEQFVLLLLPCKPMMVLKILISLIQNRLLSLQ